MDKKQFEKDVSIAANQYIKEKNYWLNQLAGDMERSTFPYDHTPLDTAAREMHEITFEFEPRLVEQLNKISRGSFTNLNMILAAGLFLLTEKYTGSTDTIIGTPIYKQKVDAEFINTLLILRNADRSEKTFKELLIQMKKTIREAEENRNYPIETILYDFNPSFFHGETLCIDIAMLLENIHTHKYIEHIEYKTLFRFSHSPEKINLTVEYDAARYSADAIRRIGTHYTAILQESLGDVDTSSARINFLSPQEIRQLSVEFNNNGEEVPYPHSSTLHRLFEARVEKKPRQTAISGISLTGTETRPTARTLTYGQLNEKANQLARQLVNNGLKQGTIAAVMLEPSLQLGIAILAVLKAGGAYLPLDLNHPRQRMEMILNDSGAEILVTQSSRDRQPFETHKEVKIIDIHQPGIEKHETGNLDHQGASQDPAYVIYTSGSTGKPRGVIVEHHNIINYIYWRKSAYEFTARDISLQLVPFTFDGFCSNFYPPLLSGGRVVMPNKDKWTEPRYIRNLMIEEKVTNASMVPSVYTVLLNDAEKDDFPNLRFIALAGEQSPAGLIKGSRNLLPHVTLINEYGPTEASVAAAANFDITLQNLSVIGRPADNNRIYILDKKRMLAPIGAVGEIYISGDSIARGYLNRPQLTAERFITRQPPQYQADPLHRQSITMYRTGDLARRLQDGNIEFYGRSDHQVKIRGTRIELGEIEKNMTQHSHVKEAVVLALKNDDSENYLCGYITADSTENVIDTLREHLFEALPDYMVPAFLVQIEHMPLTPNGKIDRKALPEPKRTSEAGYVAPENPLEETLTHIWAEVLAQPADTISVNANFFEIGGHSLSATIVTTKIFKEMQLEIPIAQLFKQSTIRELAGYIAQQMPQLQQSPGATAGNSVDGIDILQGKEKRAYYPLTCSQKELFKRHTIDKTDTRDNILRVMILPGTLEPGKLDHVFKKLLERHEAFRTTFHMQDGEPVMKVREDVEFEIEY
ncbi:MAG: amino acid adenylation domain-containing protein, partial [bacterium]|nr:amino acid adenylation domain-containing protein [bacterium]